MQKTQIYPVMPSSPIQISDQKKKEDQFSQIKAQSLPLFFDFENPLDIQKDKPSPFIIGKYKKEGNLFI